MTNDFFKAYCQGLKLGFKAHWKNGGWLQWLFILFAIPFGILTRRRWKAADKSERKLLIGTGLLFQVFNLGLGLFINKRTNDDIMSSLEDGTLFEDEED